MKKTKPKKFLNELINTHYPVQYTELYYFRDLFAKEPLIADLIRELETSIELSSEEKTPTTAKQDTFITIINIINTHQTLTEKNLILLEIFFAEFPQYLFHLNEPHQKILLERASATMKQQLKKLIWDHERQNAPTNFLFQYIEIASAAERTEIAEYYFNSVLTPIISSCFYDERATVVVALIDYLDEIKIANFIAFLISSMEKMPTSLQYIGKHLEKLSSKLNQTTVSKIIHCCKATIEEQHSLEHISRLLFSLSKSPREEGKPLIIEKEILQILEKLKTDKTDLIVALRHLFSDEIRNSIIQNFLDRDEYPTLIKLIDVLSDAQLINLKTNYLNWIDIHASRAHFNYESESLKAIAIFKDPFDRLLKEYMQHNLSEFNSSNRPPYIQNKFLILFTLIPLTMKQRILNISLALLETNNDISAESLLHLIIKNLDIVSKEELPRVIKEIFIFIQLNTSALSTQIVADLKKFVPQEECWEKTLANIFSKINNEIWETSPYLNIEIYVCLASASQMDVLIEKFYNDMLITINTSSNLYVIDEDLREFVYYKCHLNEKSQFLIKKIISIFLNQVTFNNDFKFEKACQTIKFISNSIKQPYLSNIIIEILNQLILGLSASADKARLLMAENLLDEIQGDEIDENRLTKVKSIIKEALTKFDIASETKDEVTNHISSNLSNSVLIKYLRVGNEESRKELLDLVLAVMEVDYLMQKIFSLIMKKFINKQTPEEHRRVREFLGKTIGKHVFEKNEKLVKILNSYLAHPNAAMSLPEVAALPLDAKINKKIKFLTSRYSMFVRPEVEVHLPPVLADVVVRYKFSY